MNELKILEIPKSIHGCLTRKEYVAWVAIDNDNPITTKLTKSKIYQDVCVRIQHNEEDEDQEDDEGKFIAKPLGMLE